MSVVEQETEVAVLPERIRVLLVDDEPGFADMSAEYIERENGRIDTFTATSGDEALDLVTCRDVDCIVSDFDMPGMNGLEFLQAVRETDERLPFILFTGKGSEEIASEAISVGVTDYLQKETGTDQYTILTNRIVNAVESARIHQQRQRQLDAIESAHEGISFLDEDGTFIYVNESFADFYGYEPDEMIGKPWELTYPDDDLETVQETIFPELRERGEWRGQTTGYRADGTTFVEENTLSTTDGGELISIVRDITDREERKEELERYETIIQVSGDPVYTLDEDGRFTAVNEALVDVVGYSEADLIGEHVSLIMNEADVTQGDHLIASLLSSDSENETTFEMDVITVDGETIPCENHVALLPFEDEFRGTVGILRNITDRKQRERELERYERLVEAMGDAVYALDSDARIVEANEQMVDLTGYERSELIGEHVSLLLDDDEIEKGAQVIRKLIDSDDHTVATYEQTIQSANGEAVRGEVRQALLPRESGAGIRGTVGTIRDISDRKSQERELRETKEQLETIIENTTAIIYIKDLEGRYTLVNSRYADVLDMDREDILGKTDFEIQSEKYARGVRTNDRRALETEGPIEVEEEAFRGGRVRTYISVKVPIIDDEDEPTGICGISTDITDQKERERKLERKNERLDEFASVVSHDLRNPLTVAAGHLDLARQECDDENLDAVKRVHDRMKQLIEDLLTLARSGEQVPDLVSVPLADLTRTCWENVDTKDATLTVATERSIFADRGRFQQLLENLLRNAIEHGGRDVSVTIGDLGDRTGLYVEDDGPGIPADERDQVTKSRYTTADGRLGFGLAIARDISEAHDWELTVTEGEEGGARFEITGVEFEA